MSKITPTEDSRMKKERSLQYDIQALLNKYSRENDSNTPDYLLAEYLMKCLQAFEFIVLKRDIHKRV